MSIKTLQLTIFPLLCNGKTAAELCVGRPSENEYPTISSVRQSKGEEVRASYVIRGGEEGRARLRIISHALWPTTLNLLNSAGIKRGMACLDVGCGGGDVTFEMARLVGSSGMATGIDMDSTKIQLAQQEAEHEAITNIKFLGLDIDHLDYEAEYDLVYARFVLTHGECR
jgi:2-polyprenyl-3-methyl-5-hydroxy-6-metoxy-1,4-benzoquinol methylase